MRKLFQFEDLKGKTFHKVEAALYGEHSINFYNDEGVYTLCHQQDYCESVGIESIVGELSDLENQPILLAEQSECSDHPSGRIVESHEESQLWTFYKLATVKGYVDIRWYGKSTYYSISVELYFQPKE